MPSSLGGSFWQGAIAIVIAVAATAVDSPASAGPLAERHRLWLDEEVRFLLSSRERDRFLALTTDGERDRFIERFWERRDPTPGTAVNEARDAQLRRLAESDRRFGAGRLRGRFTERGRILQLLGEPAFRESLASAGNRLAPLELWHYTGVRSTLLPESFYLVFFRPLGDASYRLWDPAVDGLEALLPAAEPGTGTLDPRSAIRELDRVDLELGLAVSRLVESSPSESTGLLATLAALPDLLDRDGGDTGGSVTADASFARIELRGEAAVLDDDAGVSEIHYSLDLPPEEVARIRWLRSDDGGLRRSRFTISGRLVGDGGELDHWEDALELEEKNENDRAPESRPRSVHGLSFQGRRLLAPGTRELELTLVNEGRASGSLSVMPRRLLLARSIAAVSGDPELPFRVGGELVSPLAGDVVAGSVTLVLDVPGVPDVPDGREAPGEIYWELEAENGGAIRWTRREPIAGSLVATALPMEGRAPGRYRVRARHAGGVEERSFAYRPGAGEAAPGSPSPRVIARERTPVEESRYRKARASAFSRRGDRARAIDEMARAVASVPGDPALHLDLAALRYAARRFADVVDELEPRRFDGANESDRLVLLAASWEALGRFDRAAELYEQALALAPADDRVRSSLERALARARAETRR